ncbi:MAG: hypothetical protein SWH54_12510 [Thermodesulfobacteriota bacterium]|nr:hypothetical protein [Thermodesulfobacteriota bacterium]
MAIESHIRPEDNLVVLTHVGEIGDDEFLAFYNSFFKSDTFKPSMNILVDLRKADSSPRSAGVLRRFAEFLQAVRPDITSHTKVAVVAPKDLSFGLARMYEVLSDSVLWNFAVFRAMDAALAWLGLREDSVNHETWDA